MNLVIHPTIFLGTYQMPGAVLCPGVLVEMFNHPKRAEAALLRGGRGRWLRAGAAVS